MLAVVKERPEPGVVVREVDNPNLSLGEVLIRMDYAGLCGSDVATYRWSPSRRHMESKLPAVIGHEGAGTVIEVSGSDVELVPGDRVVPEPLIPCLQCIRCLDGRTNLCPNAVRLGSDRAGTMAEMLVAPAWVCHRVPNHLSQEQAVMLEVLAVAMHAVRRAPNVSGRSCLVVGPGTLGLSIIQILRAMGAAWISLVGRPGNEARLAVGDALGADETLTVTSADELVLVGRDHEVSFEAAGSSAAIEVAARMTAPGGAVVTLGGAKDELCFDYNNQVRRREIDLLASRARVPSDWLPLMNMIDSGVLAVGGIPTTILPLSEATEAFESVSDPGVVKVLVACSS